MAQLQQDSRFTLPEGLGAPNYTCQITAPFTALRRTPEPRGALDTELLFGQDVDVYTSEHDWALVKVKPLIDGPARPNYVGYVRVPDLSSANPADNHARIMALAAPVFVDADIKSHILMALPMNSAVRVLSEDEKFARLEKGYIHRKHITRMPQEIDFTTIAQRFIGRPYIWGGTGGIGVDCSGLVQMSLYAVGIDAPRDADQQELHLGRDIELAQYKRGDLLFWPGHVGIMQNSTQLLHANAYHMETSSEPLADAINRIGPPRRAKRLS